MRQLFWIAMAMVLLVACNGRKTDIDPFETLASLMDSTRIVVEDTLLTKTEEEEKLVPVKADEIFDDFILSFATDSGLQKKRIVFPLSFYDNNLPRKISEEEWSFDPLFTNQRFYTLLFDKEEQMDMVQDTSLSSVQFEWIEMKTHAVKKYYFERKQGAWLLEAIDHRPLDNIDNEDFIRFFLRFATDTLFQMQRVAPLLTFVTNDPDDEFSILEANIEKEQWPAFRPELPTERLSNINYGQRNSVSSSTKILSIKGLDNGLFHTLFFSRRNNGNWMLYKVEDLSN